MPPEMLTVLFHRPPECLQTCLAAILVLSFGTGVASVGALYRLVHARLISEAHPPRAVAAADRTQDLLIRDASVFGLVALLTRYALFRRPNA